MSRIGIGDSSFWKFTGSDYSSNLNMGRLAVPKPNWMVDGLLCPNLVQSLGACRGIFGIIAGICRELDLPQIRPKLVSRGDLGRWLQIPGSFFFLEFLSGIYRVFVGKFIVYIVAQFLLPRVIWGADRKKIGFLFCFCWFYSSFSGDLSTYRDFVQNLRLFSLF